MGRPRGSKNKKPESPLAVLSLTDEDLAEARKRRDLHAKRAREFAKDHVAKESRLKEAGEVSELTVPQILPYDMSAAFTKIALEKARQAGFADIANLRKTADGWVFEALNMAQALHAQKIRLKQAGRPDNEAAA